MNILGQYEIFVEKSQSSNVNTLGEKVQSVESGIDFGIGLRLVYGTKVLYGYTNNTCADEMTRILSDLAARDLRDPLVAMKAFDYRDAPNHHPLKKALSEDPAIESRIAYLLKADVAARAASNLISQTRGMCRGVEQRIEIFNSEGLHTEDTRHYVRATMTSIASDGSKQATGMRSDGGMIGWEIAENLDAERTGAEAARQAIVNELQATLDGARLEVDVRHLLLVADVMTSEGEVRAIGRHGVSGTKHSILARAAFEVTVNHLLKAGIIGERDQLTGVAENIIVGQPISLGTGSVELYYIPEE